MNSDEYLGKTELINKIVNDIIVTRQKRGMEDRVTLNNIIENIQFLKDKYLKNNKESADQVFNISPKIQLNLLLNFESYDVGTVYEDQIMPEEKLIKFNIGHLKLNFRGGKLMVTQERINGKAVETNKQIPPNGAFGVIKDDGKFFVLFFRFDDRV